MKHLHSQISPRLPAFPLLLLLLFSLNRPSTKFGGAQLPRRPLQLRLGGVHLRHASALQRQRQHHPARNSLGHRDDRHQHQWRRHGRVLQLQPQSAAAEDGLSTGNALRGLGRLGRPMLMLMLLHLPVFFFPKYKAQTLSTCTSPHTHTPTHTQHCTFKHNSIEMY